MRQLKFSVLSLAAAPLLIAPLLSTPLQAAPRDVSVTLKAEDNKAIPSDTQFVVFGDKGPVAQGPFKNIAQLHLDEGIYAVWVVPDIKKQVPGRIWRGMPVGGDGPQKWDLTMPVPAAVQGRILLAN